MPDANGYLLPDERRTLLRRYAPVLVLFPESYKQAPYPDEGDAIYTMRGSYHPRDVAFFLKYARLRYRRRRVLRRPGLFFRPRKISDELAHVRRSISERELQKAIETYQHDPAFAGLEGDALRHAVQERLAQWRLSTRIRGFDLPLFRGHNLRQWTAYFKHLSETDPLTRRAAVYGRLVQGMVAPDQKQSGEVPGGVNAIGPYDIRRNRIALQYWFQYYYDDWANRHEGDWESITILLEIDPALLSQNRTLDEKTLLAGVTEKDVGYSAHEDGHRRLWDDVQKTAGGRPIVYVARGSSASYFSWQLTGFPTSARVGAVERLVAAPSIFVRGWRIFGRRWDTEVQARFTGRDPKNTDWVAADPLPRDRLDDHSSDPRERLVPPGCRGVRRVPDFGPHAGQNAASYHLETDDLFWLEMVEAYGVQWGENSFLPGTQGPSGANKAKRDKQQIEINCLAYIEHAIEKAVDQLMEAQIMGTAAIPELDRALRSLRPTVLRRQKCFPASVRTYINTMWAAVLSVHPEAWPGGPGLWLRWVFSRRAKPDRLLQRQDPMYHLKSLLAQVRRTRYEIQADESKWDNPFAWVRHVCRADTFYYGISPGAKDHTLDLACLDCADVDMSVT
ncbi:MAG: hypothetical protein JW966_12240 [Anaerolineae bacterium]|nr:hypothetical protein [Anaerolineae bacterium]